ncbi:type I restriction-modification system subunit M N-terminal domain-containing protein [Thiothrix eikelboomii]|uniref:type I restriction-modification system subunit M N-terminal domain-containing protein n=1 Tax=Thiothrix eikelboomii TaxID=92487 RepID=UPI003BB20FE3
MTDQDQKQLGATLWNIADQLRGAMNADDFRDYMLSFLFLRYLSDNYEIAAKKELGSDYPDTSDIPTVTPLSLWYQDYPEDIAERDRATLPVEQYRGNGTHPRLRLAGYAVQRLQIHRRKIL